MDTNDIIVFLTASDTQRAQENPIGLLGEWMEGPSDINTCNNIQASILDSFCCIGKNIIKC